MDAKTLYEQGVSAIKQRDMATGRKLITQSLRLNDQNDMAWLWLSRTIPDRDRQIQCVERALSINPNNKKAQAILKSLCGDDAQAKSTKKVPDRTGEIDPLLRKADLYLKGGNEEAALGAWVDVLNIQPDNDVAIKKSVQLLIELNYEEDAEELLWRAIEAGTTKPTIYMTAIDLAKRNNNHEALNALRDMIVKAPEMHPAVFLSVSDDLIKTGQYDRATALLARAVEQHPNDQKLLMRLGGLHGKEGRREQAVIYFNRAAAIDNKTPEGKEADKMLQKYPPVLTDKERGSSALAWREALGVGAFFLLMAWQDAGLDLLRMSIGHWIGVIVGTLAGYLIITATSSPQQMPLATWFGEEPSDKQQKIIVTRSSGALHESTHLPIIPPAVRVFIGGVGFALALLAIALVFNNAFALLLDPVPPPAPNYQLF